MITIISTTNIIETGRDHDYDWAISEPISDQSLVQLAGRVLRHRDISVKKPNMMVLDRNVRKIIGDSQYLDYPGIETEKNENDSKPVYELTEALFDKNKNLLTKALDIEMGKEISSDIKASDYLHSNHLNKVDSACCLCVPNDTNEMLRTAESIRAFNYLIEKGKVVDEYLNQPLSNLNTTSKNNSLFRYSDGYRQTLHIEKKKPEWGMNSDNWLVQKDTSARSSNSEESDRNLVINVKDEQNSNDLLNYDFNCKLSELTDKYEVNKGSLQRILLSLAFQISDSVTEIGYSPQKGVEEQQW